MRNAIMGLVVAFGLLFAPAAANACFLCGMIVGSALSSSPSSQHSSGGLAGDVLYVMPRVNERVADPLSVRQVGMHMASSPTLGNFERNAKQVEGKEHSSLKTFFTKMVPDSDSYEILAVQRFVESSTNVLMLYTFIEKEKVTPLGKLEPKIN